MTIQAPTEYGQGIQQEPQAEQEESKPAQAETAPVTQAITETRMSIYARFTRYHELNRELRIIVLAGVENAIIRKGIGWYSRERINEVVEFIMRTAKQRGWEEEQIVKASEAILDALERTGELRTSGKSNRVSRLLEKAVLNI